MESFKHKRQFSKQTGTISVVILLGTMITISVIWNFLQIKDETGTANILQLIVSLVAIISGVSGVIIGLSSIKAAQLDSIRDYFSSGDTSDFSYARSIIYKYGEYVQKTQKTVYDFDFKMRHYDQNRKEIELTPNDIFQAVSFVANFFHQWGLLAKNNYLPLWVFESASGVAVYRLFNYSKEIIDNYRLKKNPFYAENFEWLYNKISKIYKREINAYLAISNQDESNQD